MPTNIVDGGGAVIESVGDGRNLVIRPVFCQFFKGPVNVANGGLTRYNVFAVHLQHVLKDAVRGRVGRPKIEGIVLLFLLGSGWSGLQGIHQRPKYLSSLSVRVSSSSGYCFNKG